MLLPPNSLKLKLSLTTISLFILQFVFAQNLKLNVSEKINDNSSVHYCGSNSESAFLLLSKYSIKHDYSYIIEGLVTSWDPKNELTLVKYNTPNLSLGAKTPFSFKHEPTIFYDSFISDNNLYFFYMVYDGVKSIVYAETYDLNGKFKSVSVILESDKAFNGISQKNTSNHIFVNSENKKYFCLFQPETGLHLFDKDLKKVWSDRFNYNYLTDIKVMDDGAVFALAGSDIKQDLLKFDLTGKSIIKNVKYSPSIVSTFKLKVDEKRDQLCILTLYGVADSDFRMTYGPTGNKGFLSKGILVNSYDLETLKDVNSIKVDFSKEVQLAISIERKIEKIKGLNDIVCHDLFITSDGGLIAVLQEAYTDLQEFGSGNKAYIETFGDIILIKVDNNGNATQKYIDRLTQGRSQYNYLLSMSAHYENDKLCLMYNSGKSSYELHKHVFDSKLQEIGPMAIIYL